MRMNSRASWRCFTSGLTLAATVALSLAGPAQAAAGASASAPSASASAPAKKKTSTVPSSQQIDINSAKRDRLKTLPGIGDAEADKIIAGRPYYSKTDLVLRNILPESSYAAIKYRIFAVPPAKPKPTK